MRRFVCVSCGKTIEHNWCTGPRGRDLSCPDCGSRVYRENPGPARGRRPAGARAVDDDGREAGTRAAEANTFQFACGMGRRAQWGRCGRSGKWGFNREVF